MQRAFLLLLVSVCGSALAVALGIAASRTLTFAQVRDMAASVFFVDSVTADGLKEKYARAARGDGKVRVLIVPGHDNESWGTEFNGVREADMTAAVGEELSRLLSGDTHYEPVLVRTREGYAKEFSDYFAAQEQEVRAFVANKKKVMSDLFHTGLLEPVTGVVHNRAKPNVVWKLYALNKWANDNRIDIALHLHFNDYPGRPRSRAGRFDGFALYIPEEQFSNARASRALSESLFAQFAKFYAESNFPREEGGIVPDQDLIAVGAYNTLDPASVLIEYGYIYEERFRDDAIREQFLKELAFQTYQGLNRFFGKYGELFQKYPTTFLPHEWREPLAQGLLAHPSVLSLQAALLLDAVYPPEGDKRACPLTGSFGPCTARAVKTFQVKNGFPTSGVVGELTLEKLNEKYSR